MAKSEKWNWLPNRILRTVLIKRFKTSYAGYILAPVQLAQSKFVEQLHRVPAKKDEEKVTVHSVHKKNVKPSDVARALMDNKFDDWLTEHADEQTYTADSLDKPVG